MKANPLKGNSMREPTNGELFLRKIVYMDASGSLREYRETVKYLEHHFEYGQKVYIFERLWTVNGHSMGTQQILVGEGEFPITNNEKITDEDRVSFITYETMGMRTHRPLEEFRNLKATTEWMNQNSTTDTGEQK